MDHLPAAKGRPELSDRSAIKTKPMTIVLSESTYNQLERYAEKNRRSRAAMVRLIIEDVVGKDKDCGKGMV